MPPPSSESEEEPIYANTNVKPRQRSVSSKGSIKKPPKPTPRTSKASIRKATPREQNCWNPSSSFDSQTNEIYSTPVTTPSTPSNYKFETSDDGCVYTTFIEDPDIKGHFKPEIKQDERISVVVDPPTNQNEVNDNAKNEEIYSAVKQFSSVEMRKKKNNNAYDQIKSFLGEAPELPPKVSGDLIKLHELTSPTSTSSMSSPNLPEPPYPPPTLPDNFLSPIPRMESFRQHDCKNDNLIVGILLL